MVGSKARLRPMRGFTRLNATPPVGAIGLGRRGDVLVYLPREARTSSTRGSKAVNQYQ
jgi:hypothetical protein